VKELQVFKDDITERDDTVGARAAIDNADLIQLDEGSWWSDEGGAHDDPRTVLTNLHAPAPSVVRPR
jgi:hypothetical protein